MLISVILLKMLFYEVISCLQVARYLYSCLEVQNYVTLLTVDQSAKSRYLYSCLEVQNYVTLLTGQQSLQWRIQRGAGGIKIDQKGQSFSNRM